MPGRCKNISNPGPGECSFARCPLVYFGKKKYDKLHEKCQFYIKEAA